MLKLSRPVYIVVMGVSGCGKSTIAEGIANQIAGAVFVDGDDLHPTANIEKMSSGIPLEDSDRWPWLDTIRDNAQAALRENKSFVVACSALKRAYRQRLCAGVVDGYFIYLDGSRELITKRQQARADHFMPSSLVDSQFDTLEVPEDEHNVVSVSIERGVNEVVKEVLTHLRDRLNK